MGTMATIGSGAFPLGTHVYRAPALHLDQLHHDIPLLKRLGFTMIKVQESWAYDEPQPGAYDFAAIEQVLELARANDLGVYLGFTMEQAPAWLWRTVPDCHPVLPNGEMLRDTNPYVLPGDGKPGPCWDHPAARAAAQAFLTYAVQRLSRFENIWTWNTFQEIDFHHGRAGVLGLCYCPHTIAAFRAWLQQRFGALTHLNAAWQTAYGVWDDIDPPRAYTSVPAFIDWRYFMRDIATARALQWKTATIKAHDPLARPVFSHLGPPVPGAGFPWRWAETGDFWGNSYYPAWDTLSPWDDQGGTAEQHHHRLLQHQLWNVTYQADMTRSANGNDRPLWAAELQGGPIATHLHIGPAPTGTDIQRWLLSGLAAGWTGISFWNHRAESFWAEGYGFGLLDPQGDMTERLAAVSQLGQQIQDASALLARGQVPRAPVAICIDEQRYHFMQGSGEDVAQLFTYNMRGLYARLWRMGIPVDFVEAAQFPAGVLTPYQAVILPMPVALDPEIFVFLEHYVAQGGFLISEACPGRFTTYGFGSPTQMVAGGGEVFGVEHGAVRIVKEPDGERRWTPNERSWEEFLPPTRLHGVGEFAGLTVQANYYLQTLQPTTAIPLLTAGDQVVATLNVYQQGQAVLLGTYLGLSALVGYNDQADQFVAQLLKRADISPQTVGPLLLRKRQLDDHYAYFLTNPTPEAVVATFTVPTSAPVRDIPSGVLIQQTGHQVTMQVPALNTGCLIISAAD